MRERVSLRKKSCPPALFQLRRVNISELNRKVGQIQIQFFGKANGGSELRSNSQMKFARPRFLPRSERKAFYYWGSAAAEFRISLCEMRRRKIWSCVYPALPCAHNKAELPFVWTSILKFVIIVIDES